MSTVAFALLALTIGMYILFDGYDLGIAAISPFITKTAEERSELMKAIGPVWNGNEVWLIVAGAALFALFPTAYASAFSGFYLPFMMVLWLLMFRGIALELRNHIHAPLWNGFWDFTFSASSTLLILLFGIAFGNLLRGLPLDHENIFIGSLAALLNLYAVSIGIFAVAALALHGLTYAAIHATASIAERCYAVGPRVWVGVLMLYLFVTVQTYFAHHSSIQSWPITALLLLNTLIAFVWLLLTLQQHNARYAFRASSYAIGSMFVAGAQTLYPYLLPRYPFGTSGLTIFMASPPAASIGIIAALITIGIVAMSVYRYVVVRHFAEPKH